MPEVRVGQVWADNDPRCAGRTLRVDTVDDHKVLCTVLTNDDHTQELVDNPSKHPWMNRNDRRGRTTRISLARFKPTSTGYRLIEEAPDAA